MLTQKTLTTDLLLALALSGLYIKLSYPVTSSNLILPYRHERGIDLLTLCSEVKKNKTKKL